MKLALGMMVHDDAHWLRLHLPVVADCFDGIVIVKDDAPEEACCELAKLSARNANVFVYEHPFNDNWGEAFNHVIDHAEKLGFDALVRLDPDEMMLPQDIQIVRELLTGHKLLCLPRYNFWLDRLHYVPALYPDYQARVWRLNQGVRIIGKRHEGIAWGAMGWSEATGEVYRASSLHIYHYGDIYLNNILTRDLKYLNYARLDAGHEPLLERPADRPIPHRDNVLFEGIQPLDPDVVGIYAPFEQ